MNESFCLAGILSFVPDAVVLANGDYPVHDYPLSLLNSVPYVVCCDGAGTSFMAVSYTHLTLPTNSLV